MSKLSKLKGEHQTKLISYGKEIKDYIIEYGNDNCDYLLHRRFMECYHRGAYNVLIELERE